MINLIKKIYQWKIRVMWYFSTGWSEVATPIAVVRDIAVILTFAKLVLNINFGWKIDALICLISMALFILIGYIMKASGMMAFGNRLSNSVNEEISLIRKIAERLEIK